MHTGCEINIHLYWSVPESVHALGIIVVHTSQSKPRAGSSPATAAAARRRRRCWRAMIAQARAWPPRCSTPD